MKSTKKHSVGVLLPSECHPSGIRHLLLAFDSLAIVSWEFVFSNLQKRDNGKVFLKELEYLASEGLIHTEKLVGDNGSLGSSSLSYQYFNLMAELNSKELHGDTFTSFDLKQFHWMDLGWYVQLHFLTRKLPSVINFGNKQEIYATPIYGNTNKVKDNLNSKAIEFIDDYHIFWLNEDHTGFRSFEHIPEIENLSSVLKIVFPYFPTPKGEVPIKELVQLKEDSDWRTKYDRFLRWCERKTISEQEGKFIDLEIREMLEEYSNALKSAGVEVRESQVENIVLTTLGFAEDVLKLRFEKLAKRFFDFQSAEKIYQSKLNNAPGKELGYIYHLKEEFS